MTNRKHGLFQTILRSGMAGFAVMCIAAVFSLTLLGCSSDSDDPNNGGDLSKELQGIEVSQEPTKKLYKVGETFDPTGIKVTLVYSNAPKEEITEGFTLSVDMTTRGDKFVTVTHTASGKNAKFSIAVCPGAPTQADFYGEWNHPGQGYYSITISADSLDFLYPGTGTTTPHTLSNWGTITEATPDEPLAYAYSVSVDRDGTSKTFTMIRKSKKDYILYAEYSDEYSYEKSN